MLLVNDTQYPAAIWQGLTDEETVKVDLAINEMREILGKAYRSVAQILIGLRAAVPHGNWTAMIESGILGRSASETKRLIAAYEFYEAHNLTDAQSAQLKPLTASMLAKSEPAVQDVREAKVDSLLEENEGLCDELAEQDEEVERLQEVVTAKNVWIDKRDQMLKDQHGSTPMEKRWKALLHRVENNYPAPIPSTRTLRDAPAIVDAIAKESNEKGFAKSGDETLTTERYVRGQALIKWWNTQAQRDGEGERTGWVRFSGDDTLEFLTLLDDFWPVEAEAEAEAEATAA